MPAADPVLDGTFLQAPPNPTFTAGTYLAIIFEPDGGDLRDRVFLWNTKQNVLSTIITEVNEDAKATQVLYALSGNTTSTGLWGPILEESGQFNLDVLDRIYYTITDLTGGVYFVELFNDSAKTLSDRVAALPQNPTHPATDTLNNWNFSGVFSAIALNDPEGASPLGGFIQIRFSELNTKTWENNTTAGAPTDMSGAKRGNFYSHIDDNVTRVAFLYNGGPLADVTGGAYIANFSFAEDRINQFSDFTVNAASKTILSMAIAQGTEKRGVIYLAGNPANDVLATQDLFSSDTPVGGHVIADHDTDLLSDIAMFGGVLRMVIIREQAGSLDFLRFTSSTISVTRNIQNSGTLIPHQELLICFHPTTLNSSRYFGMYSQDGDWKGTSTDRLVDLVDSTGALLDVLTPITMEWDNVDERVYLLYEPQDSLDDTRYSIYNPFKTGHDKFIDVTEDGDSNSQLTLKIHNITGDVGNTLPLSTNQDTWFLNIVDDTGGFFHVDIYRFSNKSASTQVAHTATYNSTGSKTLLEDNSSGIGGTIEVDAVNDANSNIEMLFTINTDWERFLRLEETGDGSNQLTFVLASLTGLDAINVDSNFEWHVEIVDDTGGFFHVDIYNNSAKTAGDLVAHTATYNSTGAKTLLEDNDSDVGGSVTVDAVTGADTSITVSFLPHLDLSDIGLPVGDFKDMVWEPIQDNMLIAIDSTVFTIDFNAQSFASYITDVPNDIIALSKTFYDGS